MRQNNLRSEVREQNFNRLLDTEVTSVIFLMLGEESTDICELIVLCIVKVFLKINTY